MVMWCLLSSAALAALEESEAADTGREAPPEKRCAAREGEPGALLALRAALLLRRRR